MGDKNKTFFRQKLEIILVGESPEHFAITQTIIKAHHLSFLSLKLEEIPEKRDTTPGRQPQIVLIEQRTAEPLDQLSKKIQRILVAFPRAVVIAIIQDEFKAAALEWLPQNNVLSLSQRELTETRKLEYALLAKTRGRYFEVPHLDLFSMTKIPFAASVRLALNQKYLSVIAREAMLTDEKVQKLSVHPVLYSDFTEAFGYQNYVFTYYDTSGRGLKKRVRASFINFVSKALSLNDYLLFDLRALTEQELQTRYAALVEAGQKLIEVLRFPEDHWDTLRESLDNELIDIWRDPFVGVYAALLCLKSGKGDPLVALLGGLWADLGLWDLSAETHRNYIKGGAEFLAPDKEYREHVMNSLNRCLFKRLPLPEEVKTLIVCTHERFDGKGFPNQSPVDKIPYEVWCVQLAESIDYGVRTLLAETGVGFRFVREKVWEKENTQNGRLPPEFIAEIADSLL